MVALGCGFDTTYWQLKTREGLAAPTRYIEVDYLEVTTKKVSGPLAAVVCLIPTPWKCQRRTYDIWTGFARAYGWLRLHKQGSMREGTGFCSQLDATSSAPAE